MRSLVLSVFVVLFGVAVTTAISDQVLLSLGGLQDYPTDRWEMLEQQIRDVLQTEQGEQLSLVKTNSVRWQTVAGIRYEINADWKNAAGETVACDGDYIQGLSKDILTVNCPGKEYKIEK